MLLGDTETQWGNDDTYVGIDPAASGQSQTVMTMVDNRQLHCPKCFGPMTIKKGMNLDDFGVEWFCEYDECGYSAEEIEGMICLEGNVLRPEPLRFGSGVLDMSVSEEFARSLIGTQRDPDILDIEDKALEHGVERCPSCGTWVESHSLLPDDSDEPDGQCCNCRTTTF